MKAGSSYEYNIPSCLKSGYYLVRHEIIALHAAWAYPGAQFYPGCHQLQVTGGGSTIPASDLVAFPGAYKPTDPGITYDAYTGRFGCIYPFPFLCCLPFGLGPDSRFICDPLLQNNSKANMCAQLNLTPSLDPRSSLARQAALGYFTFPYSVGNALYHVPATSPSSI